MGQWAKFWQECSATLKETNSKLTQHNSDLLFMAATQGPQ